MEEAITVEGLQELGRKWAATSSAEQENGTFELARRFLRVRARDGAERSLTANRAQQEFERQRLQRNIVLKARQMGMTTWISARFFLKTIMVPGTLTVQVAQTNEAAESIFGIAQRFWDCLPEEMRRGPLKRGKANVRKMTFPTLDSEFRVVSAADRNAGRGLSIQNLHCSEVSRWQGNAHETLAGLRAALSPSGELVLESTPNGAYGCFYDQWSEAEQSGLARHFFPWWLEDSYVASAASDMNDEELELVRRHGLTPAQIGYRRTLEAEFRGMRAQEFAEDPERCFRATGNCCFEIEAIESRLSELEEPKIVERSGALLTWFTPREEKEYLVAVDPAGGGSDGDYSAIQVIDMETGGQCAELRQHLPPMDLAHASVELGLRYNKAMIVVERNNHGSGLHAFLNIRERYENIYHSEGLEGFLMTASSKPRIISLLGILLVDHPLMFRSRRLLGECRTFISQPNGSTGAAPGAHDDCVMAMAIAQEVRKQRQEKPQRKKFMAGN